MLNPHHDPELKAIPSEINFLSPNVSDVFRRLIEAVKVGVYIADKQGNLVYINHAFTQMLGFDRKEELLGMNLAEQLYVHPSERENFLRQIEQTGFVKDYEVENRRKDASVVLLSVTSNIIRDASNNVIGVEGVVHDITEQKKRQLNTLVEKRKLEEILSFDEQIGLIRTKETLASFIVERVSNILGVMKCSLMFLNEEDNTLTIQSSRGLSQEIVESTKIKLGESIAGVAAKERQSLLVKNIEYDARFHRANRHGYLGRSFMVVPLVLENKLLGVINVADKQESLHHESPFDEIDLKILSAIAREVSVSIENVKLYKALNLLTITDPLTHVYNYRHFSRSLDYEIKRFKRSGQTFSMLMIDVDDFKQHNDQWGHLEGDHLLKTIGEIFRKVLREVDVICRYGGDEFVVILPQTPLAGARVAAEKIRQFVYGYPFKSKVSITIGLAQFHHTLNFESFLEKCDQALYQAKREGKNRIHEAAVS